MPFLSVVIPTHARPAPLRRLLASLAAQSLARAEWEVLVVANLEPVLPVKAPLPVRFLRTGALGVNRARNLGAREARGQVVLFLDDDVEARDPHLLAAHAAFHRAHPAAAALGGSYALPEGASALAAAYHCQALAWIARYTGAGGASPYLLGGHASYKRDLFLKGFAFDETLAFGGTETEFNWRLYRAGETLIYQPALTVVHHAELSLRTFLRKAYLQTRHARARKETLGEPTALLGEGEAFAETFARDCAGRAREPVLLARAGYHFAARLGWRSYRAGWPERAWACLLGVSTSLRRAPHFTSSK